MSYNSTKMKATCEPGIGNLQPIAEETAMQTRVRQIDEVLDMLGSTLENGFIRIRPVIALSVVEQETSPCGEGEASKESELFGSQSWAEQELIRIRRRATYLEQRLRFILESVVV